MRGRQRVAVVGCGMGGAMAATLLARLGHEVTILERAPRVGAVGAGLLLQPSGQSVLARAGLLEAVVRCGEPVAEMRARTHRGRTLVRLVYGELGDGCCAYGVHRADLFDVLHAAAVQAGAVVRLGCEVSGTEVDGDAVFIRDVCGGRHGPFDAVVAADGARSALRHGCGVACGVKEYGHGAMWAIGRCAAVRGSLLQVTRGTGRLCGLLPTGGGRCSLFWGLPVQEFEDVRSGGFDAWRGQVLALCPEAAEVFEGVTSFEQVAFATYRHVAMRRWSVARTVFLGDAAHASSPHLGQGVNLALVDAEALAAAVETSESWPEAFARYERSRRRQVEFYSSLTKALTPFFQSDGVIRGWGRDWALPLIQRMPILRGQMLLTLSGRKGGWLAGNVE